MARSQETFNKKEREKKKQKKKKEKAEKKLQRKEDQESKSFEDMIMYVDENGHLVSTPPDPSKRKKIRKEDIEIGIPKKDAVEEPSVRTGIVKFFNEEKGYGFIIDQFSKDSIFVHANGLIDQIRENDRVTFDIEMGPKGPNAVEVRLV